jgi:hypothetical protein
MGRRNKGLLDGEATTVTYFPNCEKSLAENRLAGTRPSRLRINLSAPLQDRELGRELAESEALEFAGGGFG